MPLKKAAGNMYGWVTHTHSPVGGCCSHNCIYCYVKFLARIFKAVAMKYSGPPRIVEEELKVGYGSGHTIFIEHMSDLFAADVPSEIIERVLRHCAEWPDNTYVYQTKNPARFLDFLGAFPPSVILGTTIETNRETPDVSRAPTPRARFEAMKELRRHSSAKIFVTVEPILQFDVEEFTQWMVELHPDFLNIGGDSKDHGLAEPTRAEVLAFVEKLGSAKVVVNKKTNLARLIAV